jgi:hypothetical protein
MNLENVSGIVALKRELTEDGSPEICGGCDRHVRKREMYPRISQVLILLMVMMEHHALQP